MKVTKIFKHARICDMSYLAQCNKTETNFTNIFLGKKMKVKPLPYEKKNEQQYVPEPELSNCERCVK